MIGESRKTLAVAVAATLLVTSAPVVVGDGSHGSPTAGLVPQADAPTALPTVQEGLDRLTVGQPPLPVGRSATAVMETVPLDAPGVGGVFLTGYSRWNDHDPLGHETRSDLYETVREAPGVSLSTVADRIGENPSTLRYHVRILEFEGFLDTSKLHGRRCLFPAAPGSGTTDDLAPELSAALADDTRLSVLDAVYRNEPVSVSGLASELDVAVSTACHHLTRLADDGLVERWSEGEVVLTSLTPETRSAVAATVEA